MARYFSTFVSSRLRQPRRQPSRSESGQMLMFGVLLIPILLAMTGMALDLGSYSSDRRTLQNAADSIALAASRDLPDSSAATTTAQSWAAKNNINWSDVTFSVTQAGAGVPNPKVSVDIKRNHTFAFIKIVGIKNQDVGAHAAAIKTSPGGAGNLLPWSVLQSVQQSTPLGATVTLKYDANNVTTGNFGAMRFDGTGSAVYTTTIENGSTSIVCAKGVPNCTTVSDQCTTYICPSEPGNKVGPTRTGVDYRMTNTDSHCDTFAEAFSGPTDGKYVMNQLCNPWTPDGYASLRVFMVPVIQSLCNGSCDVTVTGFALFYLEGYGNGGCSGNDCEIKGRFVNADLTVNALTGVYDAASAIHFTRLSE